MPAGIRPTQDVQRKSIFDYIGHDLSDHSFLDLFAGSGSMGLEAFSHGAKDVVFVEKDPKCYECIVENCTLLGLPLRAIKTPKVATLNMDGFAAIKLFSKQKRTFDIAFIDPPYGRELAKKALKTLEAYDILHPNSILIVQHEKRETLPKETGRFSLFREKPFGQTVISYYNSNNKDENLNNI